MRFELDRVSVRHSGPPAVEALRAVSLSVSRGERLALMGASGSGKSTLLRVFAGLDAPTEGRVLRDGADITPLPPPERGVGMVPQDAPLYGHLTLLDNVAHPLRLRGERLPEARRAALALLDRMGLAPRSEARAFEVSGGERRRAALARALVTRPSLLLLDEPFASLDPVLRLALRDEVRALCADFDCACVHATHDGVEALALGTTLAVLDRGRLVDHGPPARIWSRPSCPASAVLIGTVPMNLREQASADGRRRTIGVRPEHLCVGAESDGPAPSGAWLERGTVMGVEALGERRLVAIRTADGGVVRAIVPADDGVGAASLQVGAAVRVTASAEAIVHFPNAGAQEP